MLNQNDNRQYWKIIGLFSIIFIWSSYSYAVERNRLRGRLETVGIRLDRMTSKLDEVNNKLEGKNYNLRLTHDKLLTKEREIRWYQETVIRSEFTILTVDAIKLMWCRTPPDITSDPDKLTRQIVDYLQNQSNEVREYLTSHPDWPSIFSIPFAEEFIGHTDFVRSVAFSPDDKILATGSTDNTARLWDVHSGHSRHTLYGHKHSITDVIFNPQGDRLITTSSDFTTRIWDTKTGKLLHILEGQQGRPLAAAVSPNGQFVATAGDDGSVHIWSLTDGQLITQFKLEDKDFYAIAFAPDNRRIAVGTNTGSIYIWYDNSGERLSQDSNYHSLILYEGGGHVSNITFFSDGQYVVSLHSWKRIHIWDADSAQQIRIIDKSPQRRWTGIHSMRLHTDDRTIVTAHADSIVRLWDLSLGEVTREMRGHTESVWDAAISHDGRLIASVGDDRKARLWIANLADLMTASHLICSYEYNAKHSVSFTP